MKLRSMSDAQKIPVTTRYAAVPAVAKHAMTYAMSAASATTCHRRLVLPIHPQRRQTTSPQNAATARMPPDVHSQFIDRCHLPPVHSAVDDYYGDDNEDDRKEHGRGHCRMILHEFLNGRHHVEGAYALLFGLRTQ